MQHARAGATHVHPRDVECAPQCPAHGSAAAPAEPAATVKKPVQPLGEPFDLMTELTIVAAANLAAAVRDCDPIKVNACLRTFERADKLREQAKGARA